MQETLARGGIRRISDVNHRYFNQVGINLCLANLIAKHGDLTSTESFGKVCVCVHPTRSNLVLVKIFDDEHPDGRAPANDHERAIICNRIEAFKTGRRSDE